MRNEYHVYIVTSNEGLSLLDLKNIKPLFIFFPHWSWRIPDDIICKYDCIVFHTSDLPYGRGGSPIQNQIIEKRYDSFVCALKATSGIDEGEILLKVPVSLRYGTIEDILVRISKMIFKEMIIRIICHPLLPEPQFGEPVIFKRRKPTESNLLMFNGEHLTDLYDFIRMVDGEGYPKAYIQLGSMRILFTDVSFEDDRLIGRFVAFE